MTKQSAQATGLPVGMLGVSCVAIKHLLRMMCAHRLAET